MSSFLRLQQCAGPRSLLGRAAGARQPPRLAASPAARCNVASPTRRLTSDGYLHKTVVPTYHFQSSLPKLHLPKLEATLDRYLASVTPMATPEQLWRTREAAREFAGGVGQELHAELAARNRERYSSYISEPWSLMYLESRESLPINFSPQLTFKDDPDPAKNEQAARAASLVSASVAFFRTLRDEQLKPDLYHRKPARSKTEMYEKILSQVPPALAWGVSFALFQAFPLDMSQYGHLFRSNRIPRPGKDELRLYPDSRHIIVQRGPDFFPVTVLREDGTAEDPGKILGNLQAILSRPLNTKATPVGALTAMDRDSWAAARQKLKGSSTVNAATLEQIESALFAVCLEHDEAGPPPNTPVAALTEQQVLGQAEVMLHGDACNRWFDKSFQLIICPNGKAAVNFEHSWGDGVAVLRYFDETFQESTATEMPSPVTPTQPPQPLPWELAQETVKEVSLAAKAFDEHRKSVDQRVVKTDVITTRSLKQLDLNVDATMQLSFQLGYYRMFGHHASTYESAATVGFKHGRTETVRPCTIESDEFCTAFCTKGASREYREATLRAACTKHATLTKDGVMGKAWDRHLFALRDLAARKGLETPTLFTDEMYQKMATIVLSTSTLSTPALDGGGFGPPNRDCFGIGYGITDEGARLMISSYKLGTNELSDHIKQAMKDIATVAGGTNLDD